jgi:hypothetical protein
MFNLRYNPPVVVDASDSQFPSHQDYNIDLEKISLLSESQLIAFGLKRNQKSYLLCILQKSQFL